MKLYNFDFGPFPQRLNIYLAEKGLPDVERIILDPPSDKSLWPPAEVAAVSLTGSLPIIIDDDGTAVTESLPILEYLEDKYPQPNLRGKTAAERARVRQLVSVFDAAQDAFGPWAIYGSNLGGHDRNAYRQVIRLGAENYFRKLYLAERMIDDRGFLSGDKVSVADCVAMALLQYNLAFYDVPIPPGCPKLLGWYERFARRSSVTEPRFPIDKHKLARDLMRQTSVTFPNA